MGKSKTFVFAMAEQLKAKLDLKGEVALENTYSTYSILKIGKFKFLTCRNEEILFARERFISIQFIRSGSWLAATEGNAVYRLDATSRDMTLTSSYRYDKEYDKFYPIKRET